MKRFAAMFFCILAMLFAVSGLGSCSKKVDATAMGKVLAVEGDRSHISRTDGVLPAYSGLPIVDGDEFIVYSDSAVYISLGEQSFVRIEADSRAALRRDKDGSAVIYLFKGAVYCETAGGRDHPVSVKTDDGAFFAENADFRVELYMDTAHNSSNSIVQVINGNVDAVAGDRDGERLVTSSLKRSRIERVVSDYSDGAFFAVRNADLDRYSLPDRYIEMGEEGIFDGAGGIVPEKPSGDVSVREVGFINYDGSSAVIAPEFDGSHPIYTVVTDKPFEFHVTLNHRRTTMELECYGAMRISNDGNRYTVRFDKENDDWSSYVIYACVKAENGDVRRFTVSVVRPS